MLGGGGGGGGSWRDSLRWAEGGGGCYTIAPGKAEHLQIPAAERGEHPIPSHPRRPAGQQPQRSPRLPDPRYPTAARLIPASLGRRAPCPVPPVQQSGERQPAAVRSGPGTELETPTLCQPRGTGRALGEYCGGSLTPAGRPEPFRRPSARPCPQPCAWKVREIPVLW